MSASVVGMDTKEFAQPLQRLRDDGVHIEIDDFGAGYSAHIANGYLEAAHAAEELKGMPV